MSAVAIGSITSMFKANEKKKKKMDGCFHESKILTRKYNRLPLWKHVIWSPATGIQQEKELEIGSANQYCTLAIRSRKRPH